MKPTYGIKVAFSLNFLLCLLPLFCCFVSSLLQTLFELSLVACSLPLFAHYITLPSTTTTLQLITTTTTLQPITIAPKVAIATHLTPRILFHTPFASTYAHHINNNTASPTTQPTHGTARHGTAHNRTSGSFMPMEWLQTNTFGKAKSPEQ